MRAVPLRDLEAYFIRHHIEKAPPTHGRTNPDGTIQWGGFDVDVFSIVDLPEADGVSFLCPQCYTENGGVVGTHGIHVYFAGRNCPDRIGKNKKGETVRWTVSGTGLDDLSLTPSILLESGCEWHGFVGSNGIPPGHAG
jgi:hypothetical protein